MLGSVRFVLALLVLVSHLPNNAMPLNVGVVAVICFYFISGWLMERSYARFSSHATRPAWDFWIDRLLKLFPQYLVVLCVTAALIATLGVPNDVWLLSQPITVEKLFLNALLLPANYVFPPFVFDALLPHPLIPPAWSLSTELHFYLLLPLLFCLNHRRWLLLLCGVAAVQFSSFFFASGPFNADNAGYRYIFGVLTVFMYGFAFSRRDSMLYRRISAGVWLLFALFLFVVSPLTGIDRNGFVLEVLLGGVIALPLCIVLRYIGNVPRYQKIDTWLGDLAYPIFLSHFLAFYLVEKVLLVSAKTPMWFFLFSLVVCLSLSMGLSAMQKAVERYRIRRRGFASLRSTSDAG